MQVKYHRFFLLPLICGWAVSLVIGCNRSSQTDLEIHDDGVIVGSIQLMIDFRSQRENLSMTVPCAGDSTVLSILQRAQATGGLEFLYQGKAESAFVRSIGGVENLAANGNNWVYRVNDELGDRSCGAFSLNPGDHVLWVFGKYP